MKKMMVLLAVPVMAAAAFMLPGKKTFTLDGKIEGVSSGKIYLESAESDLPFLDSTEIKNGVFGFKGKIESSTGYVLRLEGGRSRLLFFLEPGKTTIVAHKDSLNKASVKGSPLNAQFKEWSASWGKITAQAGVLYRRLDSASEKGKVATPPEIRQQVDAGFEDLNRQTGEAVAAFIQKYPNSPVGPFLVIDRFINYPNPDMVTRSVALLGEGARQSYYGKKIVEHQRIAKKTGIGATPALALPDVAGKMIDLSQYRGKYVLVDFWASWCVPCRKENPNLVKAYAQFHGKGFEILGVSLDNNKDLWLKAIAADGLAWKHVSDLKAWQSPPVLDYGIKSIPSSFLLDKEGKVIAKDLRGPALEKKLEEIFK